MSGRTRVLNHLLASISSKRYKRHGNHIGVRAGTRARSGYLKATGATILKDKEILKYWGKLAPIDQEFALAVQTLIECVPANGQHAAMNAVAENVLDLRRRKAKVLRDYRKHIHDESRTLVAH